jgi:hypothetical protein
VTLQNADFRLGLLGTPVEDGHYRHLRLDEDAGNREAGLLALAEAVKTAHLDAQSWIREMAGVSLDPFGEDDVDAQYPQGLHTLTLQGCLGEVFAGVVAENFDPHEFTWEVPAFLFRFYHAAIEGLDRRLSLGDDTSRTPGRTGDDCIAFHRAPSGRIVAWLNCEAKCSAGHSSSLITSGHQQLARPLLRAASGLQLLDVLRDSNRPDKDDWIAAIRVYRASANGPDAAERADLFVYVCGRRPADGRMSWISPDKPHPSYRATHPLEAVEVHLEDVDVVLTTAYPGHVINRD